MINQVQVFLQSMVQQHKTGLAIANKALSKQGSRYWWGAPGGGFGDGQGLDSPNAIYFDCSGLVAWAHRQAGVKNWKVYSRRIFKKRFRSFIQ